MNSTSSLDNRQHLFWVALLVIWGPLYRALVDKGWMVLGGLPLVGQWAQLQSVSELVSAPAFAGVGMGLTVLTAQRPREEHTPLLISACLLGTAFTAPLLIGALYWPDLLATWLQLDQATRPALAWAAVSGWSGLVFGLLSAYCLGQHRLRLVLALAVIGGLPSLIALILNALETQGASAQQALLDVLEVMVVVNALAMTALLAAFGLWLRRTTSALDQLKQAMRRVAIYLPAGLSIGLLTPLSAMAIRSSLAHQIDWQAAGTATALWRASDWILSSASAFLYYHYLPKLSQWAQAGQLRQQLPQVMRRMVLPCGALLLVLWLLQTSVLPLLYDERLQASPAVTAAMWGGDLLRIVAAVFLYALFALHASKTIAWGEWLSQPLLALLLVMGAAQSLLYTGVAHMGTYALYAAVNALAVAWHLRQSPKRPN